MEAGICINGKIWSKEEIDQLELPRTKLGLKEETFLFLKQWFSESETLIAYTSGSTGTPKAIEIEKSHMIQSAKMTIDFFALTKGDTILLALSPKFIAGKMMIVRAYAGKLNLLIGEDENQPWIGIRENVSFSAMVPLQFLRMIEKSPASAAQIKTILLGGSALSQEVIAKAALIPSHVFHSYGMTETLSHIALRQVNGPNFSEWFTLLNGVEAQLDERGCVMLKTPFSKGEMLITNDVGIVNNNRGLRILGRIDEVINFSGRKLHPAEIEKKIDFLTNTQFAISAVENSRAGQLPVLVVVAKWTISEIFEVWKKLEECLMPDEMPKKIILLDQLYYTQSGKLDRRKLSLELSMHR